MRRKRAVPRLHHRRGASDRRQSIGATETVEGRDFGEDTMAREDMDDEEDVEVEYEGMEEDENEYVCDIEDEEVPEEGEGDPDREEPDESQLMQQAQMPQRNGKQLGVLSEAQTKRFLAEFQGYYQRKTSPQIEKATKNAVMRGMRSTLPGVRRMARSMAAKISVLQLVETEAALPRLSGGECAKRRAELGRSVWRSMTTRTCLCSTWAGLHPITQEIGSG